MYIVNCEFEAATVYSLTHVVSISGIYALLFSLSKNSHITTPVYKGTDFRFWHFLPRAGTSPSRAIFVMQFFAEKTSREEYISKLENRLLQLVAASGLAATGLPANKFKSRKNSVVCYIWNYVMSALYFVLP